MERGRIDQGQVFAFSDCMNLRTSKTYFVLTSSRRPSARYNSVTFISFFVRVPVLSEQMTLAQPREILIALLLSYIDGKQSTTD